MTLADAYDTICADLTLAYCGEEAYEAYRDAYTEEHCSVGSEILTHPHQEGYETVETLGSGHRRQNHIAGRLLRIFLESAFSCVTSDCRSYGGTYTGEAEHKAEAEITKNCV